MAALASAFVNIVPGTKDIDNYLKSKLPSDVQRSGKDAGDALGKSMGTGFSDKFKSVLGPAIASIGAAFSVVAIGQFAQQGITAAADLNIALGEVVSLTGDVGDAAVKNFSEFKGVVQDVSTEFGIAQDILTKGLYNALSAGVPRGNVLDFMSVAAQASIAGVTDVNTAVDGLTTVINAFGMESSDAQSVADQMFVAVKGGKTTFKELSDSMFQVGPAAAAAGVSFGEVNASIATLTAAGVPTSVATTQIRAALVALQRPTDAMNFLFSELGYESAQSAIEQEGFGFALQAVTDYADGSNGKMIELLGSVEAVSAVQVLAGTGAEKFAAELEAQANAAGAASDAFEVIDPNRTLEKFDVAVQNIQLAVGEKLLPMVESIATYISENMMPAFDAFGAWFEKNGPTTAVFVGVLGTLLVAVNAVSIATKVYAVAQAFLNAVMAINPFVLIAIAVAALVAAIYYLATETTFFQDTWAAMTEGVTVSWEAAVSFFDTTFQAIGGWFSGLMSWFADGWNGFIAGIEEGLSAIGGFFETVFNGIGDFLKGVINGYINMIEGLINGIIDAMNWLIKQINKIKIDVPATPFTDAFSLGFNFGMLGKVNLPQLAEGGFVNQPTTAIIGEAGPEVVMPLDRFEKIAGLDGGGGKVVNYYAAPNNSLSSEQALIQAMKRVRVVSSW